MTKIALEWDTLEVIVLAYNIGAMASKKLTLGNVTAHVEVNSRFNLLVVSVPWSAEPSTLTLWDSDGNHEDSIRRYFGDN